MEQVVKNKKIANKKETTFFNPFPGLRPFSTDESHLFFGREGQSDEVLKKLADNKFAAVIGSSGSGKSSLIYCGLIPVLYGGFITNASSSWHTIVTRPGSGPIENLAASIVDNQVNDLSREKRIIQKKITSTVLRGSSQGLIEVIKQLKRPKNENVLILLDQFEELFRFKRSRSELKAEDESSAYIKLFLEAINQSEIPIYVVLTMRSDFIGDCAQFSELTRMINQSHYLIPQMTRENLRDAIVGPVAVGGGQISSRLVQELLNNIGDNPDQLPILQHALMRTWEFWSKNKVNEDPMDLKHYDAIGRMEEALSQHANEAYDELSEQEKELCQRIFKTLTEKAGDNRGIRHPSSLNELVTICNTSVKDIENVVNRFRVQGRSFLTPAIHLPLYEDSVIDISHESLMRVWDRLAFWVEEEASSITMYTRLSEASELYQNGKTTLWRPPDLQLALNWREKFKPNLAWAERYNPAFERAMVFLDTSSTEYETQEQNKILQQKRTLRRTRLFAIILGVAAIFSLGFMVYAMILSQEANKQREKAIASALEADEQRTLAEANAKEAQNAKLLAEKEALNAKEQERIAKLEADRANKEKQYAFQQKHLADIKTKEAEDAKIDALNQKRIAIEQKELADSNAKLAQVQKDIAEKAKDDAFRLRMLSISQSMAVKSLQINKDQEKKSLVALKAYQFNSAYGGKPHNPDIYDGLYYALKSLKADEYNSLQGHEDAVRVIKYDLNGRLYTAGSDGKIYKWNGNKKDSILDYKQGIRSLSISDNGDNLVAGTSGGRVVFVDNLTHQTIKEVKLSTKDPVQEVLYVGKDIYAFSNEKIYKYDESINLFNHLVSDSSKFLAVELLPNQSGFMTSNYAGELVKWTLKGDRELIEKLETKVYSLAFSHDKKFYVTGDLEGQVKIYKFKNNELFTSLEGPDARVVDVAFSKDDNKLAVASFDGSVLVWKMDMLNDQPLWLKDHNSWVYSIEFSKAGDRILAGCKDKLIRIWATSSDEMANQICDNLDRNMTGSEWSRYVAEDIKYEKVCEHLPQGEGVKQQ